jgi:hypothetical protein
LGIGYLNGTRSGQPNDNGLNNESLVGYWRLDQDVAGSDGVLKDYSGLGNDGETDGGLSTGVQGVFSGNSSEFVTDNEVVDISLSESNDLNITDDLTLAVWVKSTASMSGFNRMLSRELSGIGNRQYNIGLGSNADKARMIADLQGGGSVELKSSTTVTDGKWHHVVVRFSTSGSTNIFVDGVSEDSATPSNPLVEKNSKVRLGSVAHTPSSLPWKGKIDEVRVYNRSLSQSEVEELYFQGMDGEFNVGYRSETFTRSQETDWSALEVDASVPSDTDLTATFETLKRVFSTEQGYSSLSEWNLGKFNATTADEVVLEQNQESELQASTQTDFNQGSFNATSADLGDNSGDLGIGYLNGTRSGQPNENGLNNESLVGYWRMNAATDPLSNTFDVVDYSGYDNHGKTKNFEGDERGNQGVLGTNSFNFDGENDYFRIDTTEGNLDTPNELTITFWAKREGNGAGSNPRLLSRGSFFQNYQFLEDNFLNSDKSMAFHIQTSSGGYTVDDNEKIPNSWTLYTGTYNGSLLRLYRNGDLKAEASASGSIPTNNNPIGIGGETIAATQDEFFNGSMDELRIYNNSLSESEIRRLYFKGRDGTFNGNYSSARISSSRKKSWNKLGVNASIPSQTSVNARFRSLDSEGSIVDTQVIELSDGSVNYSLNVDSSRNAKIEILGSTSNVTKTWRIHNLEVYSTEVVDRDDGLRIGYRNGSVGDNLVGYWRLDRNISGGGTVRDYSGYDSDGTALNGVSTGKKGVFSTSSFAFDHSNRERISVPDISGLFDDEATVSLWLRRKNLNTPSDNGKTGIFRLGTGIRSHYPWQDGRLYLTTFSDSRVVDGFDDTGFDKTEWHHLVISTEPGTDEYVVYRNGDVLLERNGPSTVSLDNDDIRFGHSDNEYAFNGQMDEIRLYNRSLSKQKVRELYFNGRNGDFNGSYTAEKIDKAQETSWKKLEVNGSVPSQTSVDARFNVLDSQGGVVDSQIISLDDGRRNYSLDVQASKNARLEFNGSSANATKTWTVHEFNVFSAELQSDGSERFSVGDGPNTFSLGLEPSKLARIAFNGTTSNVTQTWEVDSFDLLAGDPESGGEEVLLDAAGGESISGFRQLRLPSESGNLSFKGSADISAVIQSYRQNRSSGTPQGTRFSASVFATENGTREVTVEAWPE